MRKSASPERERRAPKARPLSTAWEPEPIAAWHIAPERTPPWNTHGSPSTECVCHLLQLSASPRSLQASGSQVLLVLRRHWDGQAVRSIRSPAAVLVIYISNPLLLFPLQVAFRSL